MSEVVIMMGYPGSGKSTVAKKMCENPDYIYVEGDLYKNSSKMIKVAHEYAKIGKSIIFDALYKFHLLLLLSSLQLLARYCILC